MSDKRLDMAISVLAGLFPSGELQATTNPSEFIHEVADEVRTLRAELEACKRERLELARAFDEIVGAANARFDEYGSDLPHHVESCKAPARRIIQEDKVG